MRELAAATLALAILGAVPAAAEWRSPHREAMEAHRDAPVTLEHRLPVRRSPPTLRLTRRVLGYYPYWNSTWRYLRFELLSTLAYFASSIDERGVVTNSHGWGGEAVGELVAAAKAAGVRVVLTVTLFDDAAIGRLLSSAERRAAAIANILAEVRRGGGQGVNIDFEFVPVAQKANFVTFLRDLTDRMHREIPGSEVTVATPAVDWSGAYDYDQIALYTDGLMIMAYGYHWTGGPPGPLSPIVAEPPWSGHSLIWTIEDYLRWGGAENRHKFLLGLPFYGNDWPTTSAAVPGTARGRGRAVFYKDAAPAAAQHGRRWDEVTKTPYYVYEKPGDGWHQVWYDDDESLGLKIDLINDYDLGGLGIWALGYDGSRPELFQTIERKLAEPVAPQPPGGSPGADGGPGDADAGPPPATPDADAGPPPVPPEADAGPPPALPDAEAPRVAAQGGCNAAGSAHLAAVALLLCLLYAVTRFR